MLNRIDGPIDRRSGSQRPGTGGVNVSGTDRKAGGRDYLQLFLQGKSIAERW